MRGKAKIINSKEDLESTDFTHDQIVEMATITVRYDDAQYPDDYDKNLKDGDDGYIGPIYRFEDEIDQAVLDRFGVTL